MEINNKAFKNALNHVAGTEEGQIVLAALMDSCGWNKTFLSTEDPQVTQYYAARRGLYGGLREVIRNEYLKKIEFNYKVVNDVKKEK